MEAQVITQGLPIASDSLFAAETFLHELCFKQANPWPSLSWGEKREPKGHKIPPFSVLKHCLPVKSIALFEPI